MKFFLIRKVLLLILVLCVVFPVFFAETLNAANFDRECASEQEGCQTDEDELCQPCKQIEAAKNFLKTFKPEFIVSSSMIPTLSLAQGSEKYSEFIMCANSPIELKVRFNT